MKIIFTTLLFGLFFHKANATPIINFSQLEESAKADMTKKKIKKNQKKSAQALKVDKLIGKKIQIYGFAYPLDHENKSVKEFLLLPWFPRCMHIPFPDITQTILVKVNKNLTVGPLSPDMMMHVSGVLKKSPSVSNSEAIWSMTADQVKEATGEIPPEAFPSFE